MFKREIRPYELSLWTLQDSFITVLKPIGVSNKGQIETPTALIKNDGTQELNFSIPMYYRENGVKVENPIWYNVQNGALMVNLRKLKLIFNKGESGEEIFEFVINKVTETHTDGQLNCEVSAEGLAFQELGKIGYKISLSSDGFLEEYNEWYESTVGTDTEEEKFDYQTEEEKASAEPINNLNYWCDKIFKNSRWTYSIQMNWSGYDGIIIELDNDAREAQGFRRTDKIYEEEYVSSWEHIGNEEEGILVPTNMVAFKEKLRLIDVEKSNIYNITQTLAETFGVYCRYKYYYDNNYHIIGRECIFYNNFFSEEEGKIDLIYPFNTSKIEREIDTADTVTKLFIVPIEDESSASGLITIADVSAHKSKEDYILNFDYLYSIGTISDEQYSAIADYERSMFLINKDLEPISNQIANLQLDLVEYEAQKTIAVEGQTLAKEQMEQSTALLNAITSGTNRLYKNLDGPYRGILIASEIVNGEQLYNIKLSQEGIISEDLNKSYGYPLHEGEENVYGLKVWYNTDITNPTYIEYTDFEIIYDSNGNVSSLSKVKLMEKSISKIYQITFAYLPQLHYQNIYNTFSAQLLDNEKAEKEAILKITEIKKSLKKLEDRYSELLKKKELLIADFENMMGPALKEGSWQAENYTNYGSKYTQEVTEGIINESIVNFIWDEENFEEEQLLYYEVFGEEGNAVAEKRYPCIDLSNCLDKIKNNLEDLSFIYNSALLEEGAEPIMEQMGIGSEMQFAFVQSGAEIKPVLLLTDQTFDETNEEILSTCFLGLIKTSLTIDSEIKTEITPLVTNKEIFWIADNEPIVMVYPRIKIESLLLKTSEDEFFIKYNQDILRKFYDYSLLSRDDNYYVTLKNKVMLQNGYFKGKTFEVAYSLSNAALSLYLDALEVSKTNAFPQVSYTAEISALNKVFIKQAYKMLNRIASINDSDLKFKDVQGYISELELQLDNPWEDKVTIQNYKAKFEDLFSTIVASSEQMKTNSFAYNNAASAFTSNGALKSTIIQNTINQTDLTYAFQNGKLTIDELNGIWATSDTGVVAMRGGGIFCATQKDSYGNWLWNTGITPNGINASLLKAGQIDTNLIKVYAGDNLRLQLNADGLFAYNKDNTGEANLNQYVVHNSDGLFLTTINPSVLNSKVDRVEISWDGLIIRNAEGDRVFYADEAGNLSITGIITANTGYIGNWKIEETGLWTEDGSAGLTTGAAIKYDDENHPLNGTERMIWVHGTRNEDGTLNEFAVNRDGTLYCNNAIVRGFISAGSFIGNTSSSEIDDQLRTISITILDGSNFIFDNKNYDNNWTIQPNQLYFRIYTNALTQEELISPKLDNKNAANALEGYHFYYGVSNTDENEAVWTEIKPNDDGEFDGKYLIWEPNYLTFRLMSDIMYLGSKDPSIPNSILYFKVEKEGKQRIVSSSGNIKYVGVEKEVEGENGEVTIETEPYIYSSTIQLTAEKNGLGKFITPMNPPSHTFIEDKNREILFDDNPTVKFSMNLQGFTLEEASKGYWLVNGGEEIITNPLIGSITETEPLSSDGSELISDEEAIIISNEKIEEDDLVGLGDQLPESETDGINIFLTPEEDGTFTASAIVSHERVPEGGNIKLTFKIDSAIRDSFCFKVKNGSDSVNIVMRSSSGSSLTSGDVNTELSTEVYYGARLANGEGSDSQYYYVWKKDNIALSTIFKKKIILEENEDLEIITKEEIEKINIKDNEDFFTHSKIYITAADFGLKSDYSCYVFTTKEDAEKEYLLMNENGDIELNTLE